MVSILSFDSRCLETLLHEKNHVFWKNQYPLFYKLNDNRDNQLQEIKYFKSAVDIAFYNN